MEVESQIFITQRVFNEFLILSQDQTMVQTRSFSESSRFKAAVDTKDPVTIIQLLQTQQEIAQSDLIIVTDNEGNILTNTISSEFNIIEKIVRDGNKKVLLSHKKIFGNKKLRTRDRVFQHTDSLDFGFQLVACFDEVDSFRRARADYVAGSQRHD